MPLSPKAIAAFHALLQKHDPIEDGDLFSRDGAKTLLYGSLYGAGDEKAGFIWIADWRSSGKPVSEWRGDLHVIASFCVV